MAHQIASVNTDAQRSREGVAGKFEGDALPWLAETRESIGDVIRAIFAAARLNASGKGIQEVICNANKLRCGSARDGIRSRQRGYRVY